MTSVLRLAFCAAVIAVSSAWAQSYDSLESTGVRFATGATSSTKVERMRITQGGLVGVGSGSPSAALHISSSISNSLLIESNAGLVAGSPRIGLMDTMSATTATAPVWYIDNWVDSFRIFRQPNISTGGNVYMQIASGTGALTVSGSIATASYLQVSGTTAACASGITGAMRYTSGTMQVCNGTSWGNIGIGVPTGTIMTFAAASCPSGWSEYTSARGRFLRGIDNGAGIDPDGTRAAGATQSDMAGPHTHTVAMPTIMSGGSANNPGDNIGGAPGIYATNGGGGYTILNGRVTNSNATSETRPANVAVLFCRYDGYQSQLQTGVATLASLSDVNVVGASNGMVLKYSGGTWIASASTGGATPAGSSNDVQFNNSGALAADTGNFTYASSVLKAPIVSTTQNVYTPGVSLTSAGTTYGYLTSAGSYLPNISSNYVSASGISVSGVVQVSGSALTCSSAIKGAIRYSTTSNTLEYCNSTAWTSVGPSTSVPMFSVHKNSGSQSGGSGWRKMSFSTELYDTNNNFAPCTTNCNSGAQTATESRFTPTVPGKYFISVQNYCSVSTLYCSAAIHKNGSAFKQGGAAASTGTFGSLHTIVDMNGTSDYLEAYGISDNNSDFSGDPTTTFFTGFLIGGGGGSGGGGATAGGTDTQVQFNDGGSALGGDADYTWNKTSNVLTVTGDINYTGLLTDTSDRRQKKNIQEFSGDALERVMKLKPVTFQMKQGASGIEYGFIAQDVLPLFPELVRDRDDTLSLNYIGLMAPMVKSMQEMKAENDVVAAQNRQLRESLHNLAAEVKTLREAVQRSHSIVH